MVEPYSFSIAPRISSSVFPLCTNEEIFCFNGPLVLQSGCEHSDNTSPHPQLQNTFVVSKWARATLSPAVAAIDAKAVAIKRTRKNK